MGELFILEYEVVAVSITLRELLLIPQVENEVLAGRGGLDRPVVWAHSCEMSSPWDWVGPDELVMTIGHSVPRLARDQAAYIARLAESGVAGIAISDDGPPPPLSKSMLRAADRLDFPVLRTGPTTPFSVIARVIASAGQSEQLSRLARLSRLSTELGRPARSGDQAILVRIAAIAGHVIHVVDARYGTEIMSASTPLAAATLEALKSVAEPALDRLPARIHVESGSQPVTCYPVPCAQRPVLLVVPDSAGDRIDPFAVLHIANLIAVELDRAAAERQVAQAAGAELLRRIIEYRIDAQSAVDQLHGFGLTQESLIVAAVPTAADAATPLLHDRGIAHLLLDDAEPALILLAAQCFSALVSVLDPDCAVGASDPLRSLSHINDSIREAAWALQSARSQGGGVVPYADSHPIFLPRTVTEALSATRKILGELLDHDERHGTELIRSLDVYLTCDRSWTKAAAILGIHRQTLGYRLRRIEQLTSRRVDRTSDIAEFWLALVALRITSEPGNPQRRPAAE